jgi:hypothetical protein
MYTLYEKSGSDKGQFDDDDDDNNNNNSGLYLFA